MSQQPPRVTWRSRVRDWLASVQNHRSAFVVDLRTAANQNKASFPRSLLVIVIGQIVRAGAVWIIKSALRDAANELGISLTGPELDFLADLAASALLG